MIKAIIFDFDGTIVDTESAEFKAWEDTYQAYGCELPFSMWAQVIGTSNDMFNPITYLEQQLGANIDRARVRRERRARLMQLLEGQEIRPGVAQYMKEARRLQLKVGVASGSPREWVGGHLERLHLLPNIGAMRCADDVTRVKPAPDLYEAVLDDFGLNGAEAVAIEDSPHGALAAKRAGLYCVVVPNAMTEQLSFDHVGVDVQLDSLAELPLNELLARLRRVDD